MSHLSVRLPDEIDSRLDQEARLSGCKRSEVVREAVGLYLAQRERERLIAEMKQAAEALSSDSESVSDCLGVADEGLEDWLERIEAEERAGGIEPDEKWWT